MLPIRTILHPTDFSACSELAFQMACALARDYQAKLLVLHAAQIPMTDRELEISVLARASHPDLRLRLEQLWPQAPDVLMEHRLVDGDPVAEILRAAEETRAEVIVMGTHGRSGLKRVLTGSVAEQVLRRARCPVVTVKNVAAEAEAGAEKSAPAGAGCSKSTGETGGDR